MESKKRKLEEGNGNGACEEREMDADTARKMMDRFTREQLLDLLAEAAAKHTDVAEQVRGIADTDPSLRKLFVRNLSFDTTTDSFKAFFSQFGQVQEGVVIIDKKTGKSKGYGFLTFKHLDGALNALKDPSKKIDGRMTIARLASSQTGAVDVSDRKIFVGNVPSNIASERLLSLFSEYGEIEEGPLGFDKVPGKPTSFALFIFKTAEGAMRALEEPIKTLDGINMFCKLAGEGHQQQKPSLNQPQPQPQPQPGSGLHLGGFVNSGLATNPAGSHAYQGLSHDGMTGAPNTGNIPGSYMNQSLPSNLTSNTVHSSQGMGGGYGGGYGVPQVGAYGGSQGAGGYSRTGEYGGHPAYGTPAVLPEAGGYAHPLYQNQNQNQNQYQHQHQQSGPPASRIPGGGMYPNSLRPFHPV